MDSSASLLIHSPSALRLPTCVLHYMPPLRLGRAFPSARSGYPSVSLLHLCVYWRYRNIYLLSIIYAFRPRLRSRLTLGGRTFPRKPQTFDGEVSRLPLATYAGILSCISSTAPFDTASAYNTLLLYRCDYSHPQASVSGFSPGNLRRSITRPVSYYALFECVAASKPTSWLSMHWHILYHLTCTSGP